MPVHNGKKFSRRDAVKMLGAALGAAFLANLPDKWNKPELVEGVLPAHAQTSFTAQTATAVAALSATPTPTPTVTPTSTATPTATPTPIAPTVVTLVCSFPGGGVNFNGNITSDGGAAITDHGFVWSATNTTPTIGGPGVTQISLGAGSVGPFNYTQAGQAGFPPDGTQVHIRAYATNSVNTSYGAVTSPTVCLVEGTLVAMADGTAKKIEDIAYSDSLLVWNFDEGRFDAARPLWIMKAAAVNQYNLLEFSDGSSLKTVYQHRIFNKELGAFTFPMTEDTPIGTTTFNVQGEEVTLVSKQVVTEQVNYYNVITDRHMNLFANGILTSCLYNNVYPIVDMKFVKEQREPVSQEEYGVDSRYYLGLRLAEQVIPVTDTIFYVKRLELLRQVEEESLIVFLESA